jgi:hypothetical protein
LLLANNQYILKVDLIFVIFLIWMIAILALNSNLKTWFASNLAALNPIHWGYIRMLWMMHFVIFVW